MKLEVNCCDEFWDDYPNEVGLTVTKSLIDKVTQGVKLIEGNQYFYSVISPGYEVDWGDSFRVDGAELRVSDYGVFWTAYVKHTNIELLTETISLEILKENIDES